MNTNVSRRSFVAGSVAAVAAAGASAMLAGCANSTSSASASASASSAAAGPSIVANDAMEELNTVLL
ncbi:MAG: hypothetical protein J6D25_00430, partial [Eggerthellaceae bacterium]|nr:hypothetical protein [Eggerthellaceae bacterium]